MWRWPAGAQGDDEHGDAGREAADSLLRLRIFRHRDAGELRFTVSELEVSALPGTRLIAYTPQDDRTRDRLAAICAVPS